MKLKDMTYEEIETLSYTDLTYLLLKENNNSMDTSEIFSQICKLLNYGDDYYCEAIGDYYTSLTIDKRFILLENNEWDIRDHHSVNIIVEEDDDYMEEDEEEDYIEEEEEQLEEYEDDLGDDESEYGDLTIVDEDDIVED